MSDRVHQVRYRRDIVRIAHFLLSSPYSELATLKEIDRRWPSLSFRDLYHAVVFATAESCDPKGRA
ncbi:MAG: hypothetical protein C5B46_05680 [Proteobacteria bacterium]|nr:MAG: hypothetical protein C5B46_05680 [Pseudomonadota bacterium]